MGGLRRKIDPDFGEADKRPSLGRLFARDFARIEDEREESAARERIRALDHVPAFLLGVHLVCAAAFLVGLGNPASPDPVLLAPLGTLIAIDFGVWAWLCAQTAVAPRAAPGDPRRRDLQPRRLRPLVRRLDRGRHGPAAEPDPGRRRCRERRARHPDRLPRLSGARGPGLPRLRGQILVPVAGRDRRRRHRLCCPSCWSG